MIKFKCTYTNVATTFTMSLHNITKEQFTLLQIGVDLDTDITFHTGDVPTTLLPVRTCKSTDTIKLLTSKVVSDIEFID